MADLRLPTLNRVFLAGRLTRDPELRYIPSGTAVCTLPLAVSRRFPDKEKSGEWREEVAYINVVTWREMAERCGERLRKGSPVLVEGTLQSRNWETQDGQKRSTIEVRALRVDILAKMEGAPESTEGKELEEVPAEEAAQESKVPGEDDIPF